MTYNIWRTLYIVYTTVDLHNTRYDVRYTPHNNGIHCTTYDIWHTTYGIQHTAYYIQAEAAPIELIARLDII